MATNEELIAHGRRATDALAERVRKLSEGDSRWEAIIADLEAIGRSTAEPFPTPTPDPA